MTNLERLRALVTVPCPLVVEKTGAANYCVRLDGNPEPLIRGAFEPCAVWIQAFVVGWQTRAFVEAD